MVTILLLENLAYCKGNTQVFALQCLLSQCLPSLELTRSEHPEGTRRHGKSDCRGTALAKTLTKEAKIWLRSLTHS